MDDFIRLKFDAVFNIERIVTILYMEFSKDFYYEGEKHDFWELVYIDKGEMVCRADEKQFVLKGGEIAFHQPNEFHNLAGSKATAANVSILCFECKSKYMKSFANKIIRLSPEEKNLLSMIVHEGLSSFERLNDRPPIMGMKKLPDAPFGSQQMTKNLIEMFLISLYRSENAVTKKSRYGFTMDGVYITAGMQEILNVLEANIYGKLTVSSVAKALNVSVSAVKNTFAAFGRGGIIAYFNELKIKEAKKLIRERDLNLTQIAEKLSYDNIHYFSKSFKKHTNMTPTEYKNSLLV